jgi:hypothetical protein
MPLKWSTSAWMGMFELWQPFLNMTQDADDVM